MKMSISLVTVKESEARLFAWSGTVRKLFVLCQYYKKMASLVQVKKQKVFSNIRIDWIFLESSNKIFKNFRMGHARKNSRINTMTDVFHRMLQCSDPLVLQSKINANLAFAKNTPLSDCVKSMLFLNDMKSFTPFNVYMTKWINSKWNKLLLFILRFKLSVENAPRFFMKRILSEFQERESPQCGNYGNLLSHFYGKISWK